MTMVPAELVMLMAPVLSGYTVMAAWAVMGGRRRAVRRVVVVNDFIWRIFFSVVYDVKNWF